MANISNGGRIEYTVGYRLDSQGLSSLKNALEQLKSVANSVHSPLAERGDTQQSVKNIQQLIDMANQLETILNKSYNVKLGTYSINLFNKELKNSRLSMEDVQRTLKQMGATGDEVGLRLAKSFTQVELKATRANNIFSTMGDTLRRTLTWNISSSIINTLTGRIQESYGYIKNLDSSLNDIRIVTGKSAEEMDKFAEKANKASKALSKSTTDYTNASLIYYQQGLSDEETAARTDVTLKAANVTQQSAAEVSEQLTAVWNGYKVSAQEAELYVDKLAAVAAETASDLEELSTGMSKVASAANLVGMDVDQMNAALATTISVTRQAPETVGTAYKTILARMTTISAGGTDEDGATLTSYTEDMNTFGINVLDANKHLRDMGDVIEEVGTKWSTMSRESQIALAQVMAGQHQYNNLTALFDNWDMYLDALKTSKEAEGTLEKQQSIYMESTVAHLQQLRTAAEGVYDSLLKPEDINNTADALTSIVTQIEKIIDSVGGLKGVLPVVLAMFSQLLSKNMGQAAGDFSNWINANRRNERQIAEARETLDSKTFSNIGLTTDSYLQNVEALLGSRNTMSVEEFNQLKQNINENAEAINNFGKNIEKTTQQYELLQEKTKQGIDLDELENNTDYFNAPESIDSAVILEDTQENREKAFEEANQFVETLRQVNEEQANDLKASIEKLKELAEIKKENLEAQKRQNIENVENQAKTLEEEKEKVSEEKKHKIGSRGTYRGKITQIQKEMVSPENNSPEKQEELAKKLAEYEVKVEQLSKEIEILETRAEEITDQSGEIDEIRQQVEEENQQLDDDYQEKLAEALENYQKQMASIGKSSKEVSDILENIRNGEQLTAEQVEDLNKQLNEQADIMEDKSAEDFLTGITSAGAGIASMITSITTGITTLKNIWENDDLNGWEKFGQTVLTVGTSVGIVVSGFSSLSKGLELIDASFKASQAAIDDRTIALKLQEQQQQRASIANVNQANSSNEVARASRNAANATREETNADREQAQSSLQAAEGNTAQATASRSGVVSGVGKKFKDMAGNAGSVLTKLGNVSGGIQILGKSVTGLAAGIATLVALAAAAGAWIWAIHNINAAMNDTKIAVEEANKSYEEQKNLLSSLKENQDSFNDSLERITEQKNSMASLVKGTEEYNEALKKTSEEIENLIEKFPELKEKAKFEKGAWSISDKDLQDFKEQQEKQIQIAKARVYAADNGVQQAELNHSKKTDFQEKYFSSPLGVLRNGIINTPSKGNAMESFLNRPTEDIQNYLAALKTSTSQDEKDKIFASFFSERENVGEFLNFYKYKPGKDGEYSVEAEEFESFLQTIIDLQNQQLEVEKLTYENNKASVDVLYSENIAELLKGQGKDENTAEIIANAVEGKNASYLEGLTEAYKYRMTKDNEGTEFTSENVLKAQQYYKDLYKNKYGLEDSGVDVKKKGDDFVISFPDNDIEEIKLSQEEVINSYAGYVAANSEEMQKSIESWTKRFSENEEAALAYWVGEDSSRVEDLSLSQLETLSNLDENNAAVQAALSEIGVTVDDIKGYVKIGRGAEEARKENLVSESGRQAYEKVSALKGFEDLTGEKRDELIEKINSIYAEGGKEGVQSFIEALESAEDVKVAFEFDDEEEQIEGLSVDLSKRLKTLKIDKSIFDNYKEQFIKKFGEASDESVVRWLESQKLFDKIEKDFDNIFSFLNNADSDTILSADQIDNLVQVQEAFETLSGLELDQSWILDNLDLLKNYIKGSEGAAQELTTAFNAIRAEQNSTLKIFADYDDTVEGKISDGLIDRLKKAGYTVEEIDALLTSNGYTKSSDGTYYKNIVLETVLNSDLYNAEDKVISLEKMSEIIDQSGVTREILESQGWYLDSSGGSAPVWRNKDKDVTLGQLIDFVLDFDTEQTEKLALMGGNHTISVSDGLQTLYNKYAITKDDIKKFCEATKIPFEERYDSSGHAIYDLGSFTVEQLVEWKTLGKVTDDLGNTIFDNSYDGGKKEKTYTKIERKTDFDINYDSWDKMISYKEKELDRLEEAAENLTGEALLKNLEERKKLYDEINKQREEELKQNEKDIDKYKAEVEALGAIIDPETGYILNERDLQKGWSDSQNAIANQYNQYINDDGSLTEAGKGLDENKIDEIKKSYDNLSKSVSENQQALENYNDALEKNIEIQEDNLETLKSIAETEATAQVLKVTNAYDEYSVTAAAAAEETEKFNNLLSDDEAVQDRVEDLAKLSAIQKKELSAYEEQLKANQKAREDLQKTLETNDIKINLTGNQAIDEETIKKETSSLQEEIIKTQKKIEESSGAEKANLQETLRVLLLKQTLLSQTGEEWSTLADEAENLKKEILSLNDALSTSVEEMNELADWKTGNVDKQLETVERSLSRLQSQEGRLKGNNLITNLNKQKALIQQEIKLEQNKLKIYKDQLKVLQDQLKATLQKLLAEQKVSIKLSFEKDGSVDTTSLWNSLNANKEKITDDIRETIASLVNDINSMTSNINSLEDSIFGHEEDLKDLAKKVKDAAKEAMDRALEIFNAKVDFEVNIEDAWRQFDRLEAKVDGLREKTTELFKNALLDYSDAIRYVTANINSYFGDAGGGSIQILTQHVNDIMNEIGIMQAGGTSSLYGIDQTAAFSDLENYYNQLMQAVEGFYDAIDAAKQKYSEAIDAIINKNKELLDDFEKVKSLQEHGINITKLLYGDESYEKIQEYYDAQSDIIQRQLAASVQQRDYYAQLLATMNPDDDNYDKVKQAYLDAMDAVYNYTEAKLEALHEALMNRIDAQKAAIEDSLAAAAGFGSNGQMNRDWEYQTELDDAYLDATNTQYEIEKLTRKFNDAIAGTDSLAAKEKLTDVMNEQLDILNEQLAKGQKLTEYDIERANKVYELTLKQIALEEAQENKSKMRLRRDSQGNYRYEYIADQDKINQAKQDLADAENDLYNFDKNRAKEMVNSLNSLISEYYDKQKEITEDLELTEEERDAALRELQERYWGEQGLITMAKEEYLQASERTREESVDNYAGFDQTLAEALTKTWEETTQTVADNTEDLISRCHEYSEAVRETMDTTTSGAVDLEEAIRSDTDAMAGLIEQDEELLNQYDQQIEAIQDLLVQLEALEAQYKSVMEAALAAVEAALKLRQTSWETEEDEASEEETSNTGNNGGGNAGAAGNTGKGNRYATVFVSDMGKGDMITADPAYGSTQSARNDLYEAVKQQVNPNAVGILWESWSNEEANKKGYKKWKRAVKYDTGGYTGEWGSDGRMAMLHEKELILNKSDTANILQAVDIVRTFSSDLAALQSAMNRTSLGNMASNTANTSAFEQNVKIEANFPNVSNANEIEAAFNNLINMASQRAMRK